MDSRDIEYRLVALERVIGGRNVDYASSEEVKGSPGMEHGSGRPGDIHARLRSVEKAMHSSSPEIQSFIDACTYFLEGTANAGYAI